MLSIKSEPPDSLNGMFQIVSVSENLRATQKYIWTTHPTWTWWKWRLAVNTPNKSNLFKSFKHLPFTVPFTVPFTAPGWFKVGLQQGAGGIEAKLLAGCSCLWSTRDGLIWTKVIGRHGAPPRVLMRIWGSRPHATVSFKTAPRCESQTTINEALSLAMVHCKVFVPSFLHSP